MATRKPARKAQQLREAQAAYGTDTRPLGEVFWFAFKELPEEDKSEFLKRLLNDPEWYEEMADAIACIEAEGEPSRPFEEFWAELQAQGRK